MAHLRKLGQKKYKIVIELGRNPATGKRKRKTKTVFILIQKPLI
ncbi:MULTISPECIES: hypothetical protein [unclassified Candidatus Frackibacter]|nr:MULTISPECIES: hypothetical protein [unclassified Candidatus Frackibacter]KXS42362.1 MAG: hypothetical protein AWU54_1361 [Candidatus Frackibacter sp. T328-2]SDC68745.1 hypothetical protein SAMN04515661_11939 [Candidatus Frackibacter sp. WG11]SEM83007.1 hypothetical protein SAMN04488698_11924 [Candidatus Frackibacter sp. WG12]SFL92280.1 hypothetical protein SAMN04488699_12039 [Candidatus Frackibacter sp. WG13]